MIDCDRNRRLGSKAKTFEQFEAEAREIHGDKFDYSDFVYVNNKTVGKIHCNKCGYEFKMTPINHIWQRQGCPKCGHKLKLTNELFKEWAREKHGDKYIYDEVEIVDSNTLVKIICPIHGIFEQTPHKHLNGHGCRKCAKSEPISFNEFVERANKKHNSKYTYHEEDYVGFDKDTRITCPIHGDFIQNAKAHSLGNGCQKCANERRNINKKISFEEFKRRAIETHGDKYAYDKESYVDYSTDMNILCKKHGWFKQKPYKHVKGQNCKYCAREQQSKRQRLTHSQYIERNKAVHGDKYIYKGEYKGQDIETEIICPIHGSFLQKPIKHWQGQGCPKCNQSHLEREVEMMLKETMEDFKYQATKADLNFLGMMSIDFYLPKYNLAIECQGIQHFEDSGMLKSENVVKRDSLKYKLCEDNNVKLIYFTNLKDKIENNHFYTDKTYFTDMNELKKYVNNYETTH